MSRARPWEDDPRFDETTRVTEFSNMASRTVRAHYSDGAVRSWSRELNAGEVSGPWIEGIG